MECQEERRNIAHERADLKALQKVHPTLAGVVLTLISIIARTEATTTTIMIIILIIIIIIIILIIMIIILLLSPFLLFLLAFALSMLTV